MIGNDLKNVLVNHQPDAGNLKDKLKTRVTEKECCYDNQPTKCLCPKCGQRLKNDSRFAACL